VYRFTIRAGALFFIILTLVSLPLTGGGRKEETTYTMADADLLIEERNYNEAIAVLIALSKQDPEYFEQAQDKIRQIKKYRDSYNDIYDELIRVLFEEEDYEKALALIKDLDNLDSNPNDATRVAIRDARISAELVYYRKIFNEIMDQALVYLGEGSYFQALKLYETGFELFRQTFDESDYGSLIKDPVYRAYDELTAVLARVEEDWDSFALSDEQLALLPRDGGEALAGFMNRVSDLEELRNRIYRISAVYDRQNRLVMEGNQGVEDFHLSFMNRLLAGRLTVDSYEGITVALDYYLEDSLDRAVAVIESREDSALIMAFSEYDQASWASSRNNFDRASLSTGELNDLLTLSLNRVYLEGDGSIDRLGKRITDKYYDSYRLAREKSDQYGIYGNLIDGQVSLDAYELAFRNGTRQEYPGQRNSVLDRWNGLLPQKEDLARADEKWMSDPLLRNRENGPQVKSLDYTNALIERGQILETDIVVAMADRDITVPEALLEEYEKRLALDKEYISGINEQEGEDLLFRYPQRALADLALLDDQMNTLTSSADDYRSTYEDEQTRVTQGVRLDPYLERINRLLVRSSTFGQEIALLKEDGENFVYLAQRDYNAGDFRYAQAERQLGNSNFQQARDELSLAQQLYVSALSYDEDSLSRDELDRRIASLQARIVDEENKKVIREVRELINQGKNLYFQGLYAQSESRLIQAENKWYSTNTEENTELAYWMSLVRTALSVESGRYLEESNPLYNEISQLLNLAWKNYQQGQNFLRDNRRVESIQSFNRADEFLNQVLILMPLNQNASVLKLRILKAVDEDNFSVTFADKYRGALQKMDFQKEQAYIELKDLAEINPDYSNIQRNILTLEYDLGIKIPPPDPAVLRKSNQLYASAKAVFDSGNLNLFAGAIEQLSEAIKLNPNNSAASELIDQMRLYEGGQTTVVLSSASLSIYQSAEEKFVAGDYVSAYRIIQDLWKDKANQAYPPLQELKRRIEASLGL